MTSTPSERGKLAGRLRKSTETGRQAIRSPHEELFAVQLKAARLRGWEREVVFAPPRRWRFDFAHCLYRIAVEIEGGTWIAGRHNRGSSIERDMEKYNAATLKGWRVLRGTAEMVQDGRLVKIAEDAMERFAPCR